VAQKSKLLPNDKKSVLIRIKACQCLLDIDLCKNIFYFHIFSFFSVFSNMMLSDALISPAGSNTASDDVTN